MISSSLDISNAVQHQLMKISAIVDMLDKQGSFAVTVWMEWLMESERLLKKYNYAEVSLLAGLRAEILKEEILCNAERRKKKLIVARALSTVDAAQKVLFNIFDRLNEKIESVRVLIRQIIVPAKEAGIIKPENIDDFTAYLEDLLQQFKNHKQLAPGINNAIVTVGKFDVLRILAEEIDFS
ncbi:MAG: hypothetical protein LBK03_03180 [Bacteroidales bacterium]|jgi:hypothetical protein|nr:hypothetical protein [Bacteroidales bacterium]